MLTWSNAFNRFSNIRSTFQSWSKTGILFFMQSDVVYQQSHTLQNVSQAE